MSYVVKAECDYVGNVVAVVLGTERDLASSPGCIVPKELHADVLNHPTKYCVRMDEIVPKRVVTLKALPERSPTGGTIKVYAENAPDDGLWLKIGLDTKVHLPANDVLVLTSNSVKHVQITVLDRNVFAEPILIRFDERN